MMPYFVLVRCVDKIKGFETKKNQGLAMGFDPNRIYDQPCLASDQPLHALIVQLLNWGNG